MRIIIKNSSDKPIYEQIKEQIKAAILGDELCEGDILPSIRELARDLKISVITTTRAYADLEQEGFITIIQGKGCYVLSKNSELVREQLIRKIEDSFSSAVSTGKIANLTRKELTELFKFILEENQYD
ncbi:MAG: GntR family transcriptional regulator [Bacillota bacterium]|nr:GntR family transcriptional regulator [Bacillota bacterium]